MALHWSQPQWLALLVLPLLSWLWYRFISRRRLDRLADPQLLRHLIVGAVQPSAGHWLLVTALTLGAVAAAGPYLAAGDEGRSAVRAVDVALVVDISPSMNAADTAPSRLRAAKWQLQSLLDAGLPLRAGIVVFSASAYTVLPLTHDLPAVKQFVEDLDVSLVSDAGSNVTLALREAGRVLAHSPAESRAVVLVSDGEFHDAASLDDPEALQFPVYGIGVGTDAGAPVPDGSGFFVSRGGEPVISRLRMDSLHRLAAATGGLAVAAADPDGGMEKLVGALRERPTTSTYRTPGAEDIALFPIFTAASLLLFLWHGFRHQSATAAAAVIGLTGLLNVDAATAGPLTDLQAWTHLQRGDYAAAYDRYGDTKNYAGLMGRGFAAHRLAHWQAAAGAFQQAYEAASGDSELADAAYNTGTSHARAGHWRDAQRWLNTALTHRPGDPLTMRNLRLVNSRLAKEPGETQAARQPEDRGQTAVAASRAPHDPQGAGLSEQPARHKSQPEHTPPSLQEHLTPFLQRRLSRQGSSDHGTSVESQPW